jgi:ribonuclease HI
LPKPHPLATLKIRICRRFTSPLQRIAGTHADLRTVRIETVHEYALPPWTIRIRGRVDTDPERAVEAANQVEGVVVATACSQRNDLVGIGGVVRDTTRNESGEVVATYHATIGSRQEQNRFTAELSAIEIALRNMPDGMRYREVTVMTSNLAAVQAIQRPRQQSGQCTIRKIYSHATRLAINGNKIQLMWVPAKGPNLNLRAIAKGAAQRTTERGRTARVPPFQARSTTL